MTVYWAGTSIADLRYTTGASNTSGTNIPSTVSEGVVITNTQIGYTPEVMALDEFWYSEYYLRNSPTTPPPANSTNIMFLDDNDLPILKFVQELSTGEHAVYKWNGSSWTKLAQSLVQINSRVRLDFNIKLSATGHVIVYSEGVKIIEYSGDTTPGGTGLPAVRCVALGSGVGSGSYYCAHSACIISDVDTRPMTFLQRLPSGNGAMTDWSGSYTDIDETGINDTDFIQTDTSGDISTFTFAALPSGYNTQHFAAVIISARARSAGSVDDLNGVARVSSTNYDVPAEFDNSPIFQAQQWQFPYNPATGQAWLGSEINAAQFGVKAL